MVDVPNVVTGTIPEESAFEHRYARYPWLAYAHIVPGIVYLLIAPFQLWRSFRNRNLGRHRRRRWMIRAFAIGLAVGTIRLWIGLFQALGLLSFRDAFGVAFWISFVMHALAAELYVRWRPSASGMARRERVTA